MFGDTVQLARLPSVREYLEYEAGRVGRRTNRRRGGVPAIGGDVGGRCRPVSGWAGASPSAGSACPTDPPEAVEKLS
eukprot:990742-Alexandrium_andersonii.AAC.1